MSSPVALILGAGPNIGAALARELASNDYTVVLCSREQHEQVEDLHPHVFYNLSEPRSVSQAFARVRKLYGEPSVVIYNAGAATYAAGENTFNIELDAFQSDLNVNTTSVFVAIQEALASFASASLPENASRTFIYTGNAMNFAPFDGLLTLGTGKSASAHMISSAATAYADKGYKFYYADQRQESGKLGGKGISAHSHGKMYTHLTKSEKQGPWLQTFRKGKGYTLFPVTTNVTFE